MELAPSIVNRTLKEVEPPKQDVSKISFEDVSFVYPDAGDYAIHDLSLEVGRGQTLGIIGGTGAVNPPW